MESSDGRMDGKSKQIGRQTDKLSEQALISFDRRIRKDKHTEGCHKEPKNESRMRVREQWKVLNK